MKLSKLSKKMVVNVLNGEVLGFVSDIELDINAYEVQHFIVEEKPSLMERVLPWVFKKKTLQLSCVSIQSIGNDVILVNLKK